MQQKVNQNGSTTEVVDDSNIDVNSVAKASILVNGISTLGFALGLYFAYKKKSHFWGYVGFGALGILGGYAAGAIGASMFNFTKK